MGIPDYQTLMLPLLQSIGDKKQHRISDLYEKLSDDFGLTEEERNRRLPSGRETYIKNRVAWARTYLKKAGLLSSPIKGVVQITSEGSKVLLTAPKRIDNIYLRRFKGFVEFRPRNSDLEADKSKNDSSKNSSIESASTPEEVFDRAYQQLYEELSSELLDMVVESSPYFFEQVVVDLMLAMGYGGSRKDAGEATKRSADGGVDGVIKLDKLGLDTICIQAKRFKKQKVGEPLLRDFAGALLGYNAKKGVYITTSKFTKSAVEYVKKIESKIVLIDGNELSKLMIDFSIGVSMREVYKIKRIDSDYFLE